MRDHPLLGTLLGTCLLLSAWGGLLPTRAAAWTEANVVSARAHVELAPDAKARVSLLLTVQIHGGWLEGLEIADLDPDLSLDQDQPPWAVSTVDPTRRYTPRVRVRGNRVALSFPRREAPRRGTLEVGLVYHTNLAHRATRAEGDDRIRVTWVLPGWRAGLDDVSITVTAPTGTVATAPAGRDQTMIDRDLQDDGTVAVLTLRRAHLPRTVPWTVEVDVPEGRMDPSLRRPIAPSRAQTVIAEPAPEPAPDAPWPLLATLLVFSLLQPWTFRLACERLGATARPLIPLFPVIRAAASVGAFAIAGYVFPESPELGLGCAAVMALLTLHRVPTRSGREATPGVFRPASAADLLRGRRRAVLRHLGLLAPFDLTTPTGLVLLGGASAFVWRGLSATGPLQPDVLLGTALLPIMFLTGTRFHLPLGALERLDRLRRFVGTLKQPHGSPVAGFALSLHTDATGRPQDARVRVVTEYRPAGLVRLDLTIADQRDLGGLVPNTCLLVVTRQASDAERAMVESGGRSRAAQLPFARVARLHIVQEGPAPRLWEALRVLHQACEHAQDATVVDGPRGLDGERLPAGAASSVAELPA